MAKKAVSSLEGEKDQYEDVFVDNLPEYLRCPICLCCLKNPYQVEYVVLRE